MNQIMPVIPVKSFQYLTVTINVPESVLQAITAHPEFTSTATCDLNRSLAFLTLREFNTFIPDEDEIAGSSEEFREELVLMSIWLLAKGVHQYPVPVEEMQEISDKKRLN